MNKETLLVLGVIVSLVLGGIAALKEAPKAEVTVRVDDGRVVKEVSVGAFPGGDLFGPVTLNDRVRQKLGPTATTTASGATAATLVANDLLNVDFHVVTLGGAENAGFTYTLPASSSLTSFVPRVGEREEVCWLNAASSTSAHGLAFLPAQGVEFATASTTSAATTTAFSIGDGNIGCIDFFRISRDGTSATPGDIKAILKFTTDGGTYEL